MKHGHSMPFGAEHRAGKTRFRLWAPSIGKVRLELGREGERALEMRALGEGWHELEADAPAGTPYRFRVREDLAVPDPASRSNPWDVNGPSVVVDPRAYEWRDDDWRGRPWHEAVVYEMHVGTFTPEGTFAAAIDRLDYLARLGVTAVELMPLADFAGTRNWGYDGVLQFAPDASYGAPDDLKRLVDAAHAKGLMVLIDVVYNHFGPEGNYLHAYAEKFFNPKHQTPWGAAINYDGEGARTVRDFFVHNALYWIEEYRFDGLRMDAIHAIADDSDTHIVEEIARAIAEGPGRERRVHVVLENDDNSARLIEKGATVGGGAVAQWNDDAHHCLHVLVSGEKDGYYRDYAKEPARMLARTLAEGFAYQGEPSEHRGGKPRGEKSSHLPLTAFVNFIQNHDQVGNRAMGDRLAAFVAPERLRLAMALLLLAPSVPLLFMGEEFAAKSPFLFFCDFQGELATAVREGRRREFASFARFADEKAREAIPDPNARETFLASKLPWADLDKPEHAAALAHCRTLLALRASTLVPLLAQGDAHGSYSSRSGFGLSVDWTFAARARMHLRANVGDAPCELAPAAGRIVHLEGDAPQGAKLAPWSGIWTLET